jgi:dipeptidyl aminopeptidase/acylaminoacyl peptidase
MTSFAPAITSSLRSTLIACMQSRGLLLLMPAQGGIDEKRVGVVGGSHGGFLGSHLIGRTKKFRAAALRNPVTSIPHSASLRFWFALQLA